MLSTIAPWAVVVVGVLFTGRTCGRALGPAWPRDFAAKREAEGFMGAPAWQGEYAGSTWGRVESSWCVGQVPTPATQDAPRSRSVIPVEMSLG